jgi:hypothetical protein
MSSMGEKYLHKWIEGWIEGFLTNWKHMKNEQKHFQGEGWSKKRGEKKGIYNCKLSEMSIRCDNLFLGFCFFDVFKPKAVQLFPL